MKTVSRVYDSYAQAREGVRALEAAGIPESDISLVANKHVSAEHADVDEVSDAAKGAGIGGVLGGGAGLLAGLGLLAIPGLGPVVAAGWLAATAVGAAAGAVTGGIVGALVDAGTPEEHAHVYSESVRRGGTLVSARVADQDEARIQAILDKYQPIDPVARGAEYRKTGWKSFDPEAPAYTLSQAEKERARRDLVPAADTAGTGTTSERIPIVKEQLEVGKRQTEERVHVRVEQVERPVEKSVSLKDERIVVERRPTGAYQPKERDLAPREFEVTERHETPIATKRAVATEEVVVSKDVSEHTETVRDTVKETKVEVDKGGQRRRI
jgi:stress response protein YsnF